MIILYDFLVLFILYILIFFNKKKKYDKKQLFLNTIFYIYLCFVLFLTLMPIIGSLPYIFSHPYKSMNLIPFVDVLYRNGDYIEQILLNVLLMTPLGFLYPLTRRHNTPFSSSLLFGFLFSFGIELIQPLLNENRASDVTDIITNTLGVIVGFYLYKLCKPVVSKLLNRLFSEK